MSHNDIYVPTIRPNQIQPPSREIYDLMGEENIFRMMEDVYAELAASQIRHMFPKEMVAASQKSAAFFVGLLGGPPLFHQQYGNPAMRARHMPFAIDEAARQVWLDCFQRVLDRAVDEHNFPPQHLDGFRQFLDGFSRWMVNMAS